MDTIKHLDLTEKDFDLIIAGLEVLPEKGTTGELMADLMMGLLTENKEQKQKILDERKKARIQKEKDQRLLTEDIKILQGKLLMLKRFLIEQGALQEAVDIIKHVS